MEFSEWKQYYDEISQDLNLDQHKDEIASEIFENLINTYSNKYVNEHILSDMIKDKEVFIFGASPSLEKDLHTHLDSLNEFVVIAADGVTSAFIKYDIYPDIIVTDLDGVIVDQIEANKKKSILIIHGHGDNISTIQQTIPKIKGSYYGTIQTDPKKYKFVKNFGGFTDGDRAVFFADHFQAKHIRLGGFDCSAKPGFYSFQNKKNKNNKMKKLQWCQKLLQLFPDEYIEII